MFRVVIIKYKKKGGIEMKIKAAKAKELKIEVNGYGCDDDCDEYFEKKSASIDKCGWRETDNTNPLW